MEEESGTNFREEERGTKEEEGESDRESLGEGEEGERIGLEEEGEFVRKMLDPKLPTQEEVDKHWTMGHIPYRNWCPICVKAKGKDLDHRVAVDRERGISEYCFDYCFPGDELAIS